LRLPFVRSVRRGIKWLWLTKSEAEVIEEARRLFRRANVDPTPTCAKYCMCQPAALKKAETLLLFRVLKDDGRRNHVFRKFHDYIEWFLGELKDKTRSDGDEGEIITEDEFVDAVLAAIRNYMKEITEAISSEVDKEYSRSEKEAFSTH
jgi:hypothetical protein